MASAYVTFFSNWLDTICETQAFFPLFHRSFLSCGFFFYIKYLPDKIIEKKWRENIKETNL